MHEDCTEFDDMCCIFGNNRKRSWGNQEKEEKEENPQVKYWPSVVLTLEDIVKKFCSYYFTLIMFNFL